MMNPLTKAWTELVRPMLQRPKRVQVAALCYRQRAAGKDVLLITSRDTGRWIVPKGWPIDGLDGPQTALQEAWEEAGVKTADVEPRATGQYEYTKGLDSGGEAVVETNVYLTRVIDLQNDYPEAGERQRKWVSPEEAANMVAEPGLQDILRSM
ncbi:NUDIX hydrolase [Sedimentitalea sp. HM32M-2]|uniref:NUDIX hydrolase n=1 Tax=Sedimentitalea sp. HM32M-2 TaxID=3351566 RepID=UPI0036273523